ncbi:HNH endonuclease [Kaistia terrae]|uniref:HNH endonuclease n=1 Tax=Kaistia terrae TaxID=537017 RepID=A0ABW0Q1R7_9HYPH|nr:HNH endonuclease [Kaistia terrae]MCX5579375.1 HNH endonuclease [Kaistia terrae]
MIDKAVLFTHKPRFHDENLATKYYFLPAFLHQAQAARHSRIIYYEPKRGSGVPQRRHLRGYCFARASIADIVQDPLCPGYYCALIENYREFDRPVTFSEVGVFFEISQRNSPGSKQSVLFGRTVLNLSDPEFQRIIAAGFPNRNPGDELHAFASNPIASSCASGMDEEAAAFLDDLSPRGIDGLFITRLHRERGFAPAVLEVYDYRCAMSRIKVLFPAGTAECEACHIQPVARGGPDDVRNGIALTATLHKLFDRGLISISDDYHILISASVPEAIRRLFPTDGRIAVPELKELRPHPQFLKFHREHVFIG